MTDPRLCCEFHHDRPATHLAPRHKGGDVDVPCEYTPICAEHVEDWREDVDADEALPIFDLTALLEWEAFVEDVRMRGAEGLEALEQVVIA
jgi:hypothetical protein